MLVSLEEIKDYLRIDSDAEDSLLASLADTAEQLSLAILRVKSWKEVKRQEADGRRFSMPSRISMSIARRLTIGSSH